VLSFYSRQSDRPAVLAPRFATAKSSHSSSSRRRRCMRRNQSRSVQSRSQVISNPSPRLRKTKKRSFSVANSKSLSGEPSSLFSGVALFARCSISVSTGVFSFSSPCCLHIYCLMFLVKPFQLKLSYANFQHESSLKSRLAAESSAARWSVLERAGRRFRCLPGWSLERSQSSLDRPPRQ